jgi:two-component system, OmpR family, response regulator
MKQIILNDKKEMKMTPQKKNVLIVDDDEDILFQLKLQLESSGFNVFTVNSEQEATEFLETDQPDIAIVDLMMEHRDSGFVLSYHIKRQYPEIPVILMTAVTSETGLAFDASTDEERAWVKADLLMTKPVRHDQLVREIDKLLGN